MKILKIIAVGVSLAVGCLGLKCRIVSLSGGGSHGAFEAGVLTKLIETTGWTPWDANLGVSAGSLGILGLMRDNYLNNSASLREVWKVTKTRDVLQPQLFENSLSGNDKIRKLVSTTYSGLVGGPSSGTFVTGVTNLVTGGFEARVVGTSDVDIDLIVASTSIPIVFPPLTISHGEVLVDGGLQKNEFFLSGLEHCPSGSTDYELDLIFANQEVAENVRSSWSLFDVTVRTLDIIRKDYNNLYFKTVMSCQGLSGLNLTVTVHTPPFPISVGTLDFDQGEKLWDLGYYNSTKVILRC